MAVERLPCGVCFHPFRNCADFNSFHNFLALQQQLLTWKEGLMYVIFLLMQFSIWKLGGKNLLLSDHILRSAGLGSNPMQSQGCKCMELFADDYRGLYNITSLWVVVFVLLWFWFLSCITTISGSYLPFFSPHLSRIAHS